MNEGTNDNIGGMILVTLTLPSGKALFFGLKFWGICGLSIFWAYFNELLLHQSLPLSLWSNKLILLEILLSAREFARLKWRLIQAWKVDTLSDYNFPCIFRCLVGAFVKWSFGKCIMNNLSKDEFNVHNKTKETKNALPAMHCMPQAWRRWQMTWRPTRTPGCARVPSPTSLPPAPSPSSPLAAARRRHRHHRSPHEQSWKARSGLWCVL